jgi:hypothetical protein
MSNEIIIVSGLPRSGTSLMMKMLEKGGMPIVTDHLRKVDIDNPEGYYELEKVKKIKQDASWLKDTRGQAFKMISMLLFDLPSNEKYKIIFMQRKIEEVLASQQKMLNRNKITQDIDDGTMGNLFIKHLQKVRDWLEKQANIDILEINYNTLVVFPKTEVAKLITFLNKELDAEKMINTINPELYRNRTF